MPHTRKNRNRNVDCAWCAATFADVVELLRHVENHMDDHGAPSVPAAA